MHMLSKKDLSSGEMDTLWRSRTPTTEVTANGEVQENEEAQVYVQDLDMFVTVQLLEETPAVLSLGELCSEHGCSHEWKNGETPRLTKHHLPAAARLLHQDQRISQHLSVSPKHHQIPLRLEVPRMHAGNRCRQTLTSKLWETVVQQTQKTRRTRKIQRKGFLIGYNPSQMI